MVIPLTFSCSSQQLSPGAACPMLGSSWTWIHLPVHPRVLERQASLTKALRPLLAHLACPQLQQVCPKRKANVVLATLTSCPSACPLGLAQASLSRASMLPSDAPFCHSLPGASRLNGLTGLSGALKLLPARLMQLLNKPSPLDGQPLRSPRQAQAQLLPRPQYHTRQPSRPPLRPSSKARLKHSQDGRPLMPRHHRHLLHLHLLRQPLKPM